MNGQSRRGYLTDVFARNVRATRTQLGLSEIEFAERVQVHLDHLGMIERGQSKVTLRKVERIADALGVDAATLLVRNAEAIQTATKHHSGDDMKHGSYPRPTPELAARRNELAPQIHEAFSAFSQSVFAPGALPAKTKQLIAIAAAHITQCPYCIRGHAKTALRMGATSNEIMEAVWVAAEMRAGAAYAHSLIALDAIDSMGSAEGHRR